MHNPVKKDRKAVWFASIVFYAVLLIASHLYQSAMSQAAADARAQKAPPEALVDVLDRDGSVIPGRKIDIHYQSWPAPDPATASTPVLLIHGSPGSGENFDRLGPVLAGRGNRMVIAPDLPGYGQTAMAPSMSYTNEARYMFELLDRLSITGRVHVVGWSSGGGVAIEMAAQRPGRVASLTMLAAVGSQETEGSGSYFFEHVKYGAGIAALGAAPELIPHFGLLGTFKQRAGWLVAFWDSDQRELSREMTTIQTPTLILHGRHDPLVAAWAAEEHHAMMPGSRLVMLDASHFLPLLQVKETAGYLSAFFARHDTPGVPPQGGYEDLAPRTDRAGPDRWVRWLGEEIWHLPWWAVVLLGALLVRVRPTMGVVVVTLFVAMMRVDSAVALLAVLGGRAWWLARDAGVLDRPRGPLRWTRSLLFALPALVIGIAGGHWTLVLSERVGTVGLVAGLGLTWLALVAVRLGLTWEGRQRIRGWQRRLTNHEYWPTAVVYLPVLWWGIKRVIVGKGLRPLTAVNPGYAPDGGVRDESKHDINTKLGDDPSVLHCRYIGGPLGTGGGDLSARCAQALAAVREDERLGGFPLIAKPDRGERGRAVYLAQDESGIEAYCRAHAEACVLQRYHPGPIEVGALWVRRIETVGTGEGERVDPGFIYAITVKHFPELVGDGARSVRQLLLAHPRFRAQASVFLERMREVQHLIPEAGEVVALGFAGNHAQGAMFTDGAELATAALTARLNEIMSRFSDGDGRGFDIGRFDLRCESLEALARGEGFGIVELNGLTSEPTNLYDPSRTIFWAWGQLMGYWKHAEALAEARIASGTGSPVDAPSYRAIKRALVKVMLRK